MTDTSIVAIVGGGQAGFQAAASLREFGFAGAIRIYGEEAWLPYQRPPLSKTYLKEAAAPDKLYFRAPAFFADKHIEVRNRAQVTAIDREHRTLTLAGGEMARWDHLVLATGVTNRRLPVEGRDLDGVVMLRGLDDAHAIRERFGAARRLVIIGGGIIGLEVAALARAADIAVDIVEVSDRLCGRIGSAPLSDYLLHYHRGLGATVHLATSVVRLDGRDGRLTAAELSNGQRIEASLALVCIGVTPNDGLARTAGLTVRDGIVVDRHMRTSDERIHAAGDCARFVPPHGRLATARLESVQNAIDQGRCAAECIAGRPRDFDALPWFWSDQGNIKLQIAGLVHGHDRTIVKADPAKGTLSVFCFAGDELIGVECINRPADFMAARRVLSARRVVRATDVEAADFELRRFM